MKIRILFLKFLLLSSSLTFAQDINNKNDERKPIDSLTKGLVKQKGIITSYTEGDKLFFEIDKEVLGKDFLMVTRFVQLPNGYSAYTIAGTKTSENLIHFEKKGKRILITQQSYTNVAKDSSAIKLSISQNIRSINIKFESHDIIIDILQKQ